jgi:hypothetical protein
LNGRDRDWPDHRPQLSSFVQITVSVVLVSSDPSRSSFSVIPPAAILPSSQTRFSLDLSQTLLFAGSPPKAFERPSIQLRLLFSPLRGQMWQGVIVVLLFLSAEKFSVSRDLWFDLMRVRSLLAISR